MKINCHKVENLTYSGILCELDNNKSSTTGIFNLLLILTLLLVFSKLVKIFLKSYSHYGNRSYQYTEGTPLRTYQI